MAVVSAEREYNHGPARDGTRAVCCQGQLRRSPRDGLRLEAFVPHSAQRGTGTPRENIEKST